MNQFELKDNQLILKVKKSPLFGRMLLYIIKTFKNEVGVISVICNIFMIIWKNVTAPIV